MVLSIGVLIAILSSFIQSLKDISTKSNLKDFNSNFLMFILSFSASILLLPVILYLGIPELNYMFWMIFFISGTLFYVGKYFHFRAIQEEEISYIYPLKGLITTGVLIVSFFFIGEYPSLIGAIGVLIILISVYILNIEKYHTKFLEPFKHLLTNVGARYYLITILCYSFTVVLDKMGVLISYPLFWTFMMNVFLSVASFKGFKKNLIKDKKKVNKKIGWLFLTLILHVAGHVTQMIAVSLTLAGYVSALKTGNLLFTIILANLFFKEKDFKRRFVIGSFIVVGVLLISFFP